MGLRSRVHGNGNEVFPSRKLPSDLVSWMIGDGVRDLDNGVPLGINGSKALSGTAASSCSASVFRVG